MMPKSRNRRKPAKGLKVPKHEQYLQQRLPMLFNNVLQHLNTFDQKTFLQRNGLFGAMSSATDLPDLDCVMTYQPSIN